MKAAPLPLTKIAIEIKKKNEGKLHSKLGVSPGKKLTMLELASAKQSSSPAERKEANFAMNARKWHHNKTASLAEVALLNHFAKSREKKASDFTEAIKNESLSTVGDLAGGAVGGGIAHALTPNNDTDEQKHRNELIGGIVGAKATSIGAMTLGSKLFKHASYTEAAKKALQYAGENALLSGAGGIVGQEIANDTASDEVMNNPKRSARRGAVGALAGGVGTSLAVSFAHEVKNLRNIK